MNRRIDLNDVCLLLQVVEHGSFSAAAAAIGVPKSTISQRLTHLEAVVGTALLRRTSRSFSLTDAGERLIPHAREIGDLSKRLEQTISSYSGTARGVLRINSSQGVAQFALSLLIPEFLNQHPEVSIQVKASNDTVDLVKDGFDLTLRGHFAPLSDSSLIRRFVTYCRWALVASPAWLASNPAPQAPDDVARLDTLCFLNTPNWRIWPFRRDGIVRRVEVSPRFTADDMLALREAAVQGSGVTCLPGYVVASALKNEDLIELLPDWQCQTGAISVLTAPKGQSSQLASLFAGFLAERLPDAVRFYRPDIEATESFS